MADTTYVARIIAKRDGISINEALAAIDDVIEQINDVMETSPSAFYAYDEVAEIVRSELGLEPDYIIDLLV